MPSSEVLRTQSTKNGHSSLESTGSPSDLAVAGPDGAADVDGEAAAGGAVTAATPLGIALGVGAPGKTAPDTSASPRAPTTSTAATVAFRPDRPRPSSGVTGTVSSRGARPGGDAGGSGSYMCVLMMALRSNRPFWMRPVSATGQWR